MNVIMTIILLMLTFFKLIGTFNPMVEWTCGSYAIYLNIKTDINFVGVAYSTGHRSNCYVYGKNETVTNFEILMTSNQKNRCGVQFDQEIDTYWVEIEVHKHVLFSLIQDRNFNVTCKARSTYFNYNDTTNIKDKNTLNTYMLEIGKTEFLTNDHNYLSMIDTVAHLKYGESYFVKISLENAEYAKRFQISNCFAESGGMFVKLIDTNGCSACDEIKNFKYEDTFATALIPSMFRFPNFKILKLECEILICDHPETCQPHCDTGGSNSSVIPVQTIKYKTTSATIHVLDEAISKNFCENKDILLFYVIIFGLILVVIICIFVIIWFFIKYRKQKNFINNFFRPLHNYRNTAFDATNEGTQTSCRSSISRFTDNIRRLSTSNSASTSVTPPTSRFYLMEMKVVPQNFRRFQLPTISSQVDVAETTSSNNVKNNEVDEDEVSSRF